MTAARVERVTFAAHSDFDSTAVTLTPTGVSVFLEGAGGATNELVTWTSGTNLSVKAGSYLCRMIMTIDGDISSSSQSRYAPEVAVGGLENRLGFNNVRTGDEVVLVYSGLVVVPTDTSSLTVTLFNYTAAIPNDNTADLSAGATLDFAALEAETVLDPATADGQWNLSATQNLDSTPSDANGVMIITGATEAPKTRSFGNLKDDITEGLGGGGATLLAPNAGNAVSSALAAAWSDAARERTWSSSASTGTPTAALTDGGWGDLSAGDLAYSYHYKSTSKIDAILWEVLPTALTAAAPDNSDLRMIGRSELSVASTGNPQRGDVDEALAAASLWRRDTPYPAYSIVAHTNELWWSMQDVPESQGEPGVVSTIGYWKPINEKRAFRIGDVRLAFYDHHPIALGGNVGPYDWAIITVSDIPLTVGTNVLVMLETNDPDAEVLLTSRGADISNDVSIVNGFALLSAYTEIREGTEWSVTLRGTLATQVHSMLTGAWVINGASEAGLDALRAAATIAVSPDPFPPAYSATEAYAVGQHFVHSNIVYRVDTAALGVTPPDTAYYTAVFTGSGGVDLQQVINTIQSSVEEWARTGNTERVPLSKLGTGTAGNTNFLSGSGAWLRPSLGRSRNGNSINLSLSPTGSIATIPPATTDDAGLLTPDDKTKLDGVSDGADVTPTLHVARRLDESFDFQLGSTRHNVPLASRTASGFMSAEDKSAVERSTPIRVYDEAAAYGMGDLAIRGGVIIEARADIAANTPYDVDQWDSVAGVSTVEDDGTHVITLHAYSTDHEQIRIVTQALNWRGAWPQPYVSSRDNTDIGDVWVHDGYAWLANITGSPVGSPSTDTAALRRQWTKLFRVGGEPVQPAQPSTTIHTVTLTTPTAGIYQWNLTNIAASSLTEGDELALLWPYTYVRAPLLWSRIGATPTFVVPNDDLTNGVQHGPLQTRSINTSEYRTDGSILYHLVSVHSTIDGTGADGHEEVLLGVNSAGNLCLGVKAPSLGPSGTTAATIQVLVRPWR